MITLNINPSDLEIIAREKERHPHFHVRRKLMVLHLKNLNLSLDLIRKITNLSANTIRSYIKEYNTKGLNSLLIVNFNRPQSELKKYEEVIRSAFETNPPSSISEAKDKIEKLTGIQRSPSQIRVFLKSIGARPLKVGVIPGKAVTEEKKKSRQNFLIIN